MKFKKITALAGSMLMAGLTVATATAANYPMPFVGGGIADVAIVYGTGAGVSSLDLVQAGNIQTSLGTFVKSAGDTTVVGGDSYKLEKTSTKFNLGDSIADVVSASLDDDELPMLLKDGKYVDDDNDEFDYTQKLTLANLTLAMFEDNDYAADEPTVGFRIANGANVMNYTLDFTDEPEWTDLETSDLPLFGKEYYVLDVSSTVGSSITLLDSADSTVLAEDETATVNGKTVYVEFIGSTPEVKLNVDGESTNSMAEGQTYKLSDGSYVGVKDILYSAKDGTVSKVEFSIGNGKLLLTSGSDIELNEDSISDLSVTITNSSSKLSTILIQWDAEDDLFVADDSEITMPGFETVKMSYGGLNYPVEEEIMVEYDGDSAAVLNDFPLMDSKEDIDFLYFDGTNYTLVGKDSDNLLRTSGTSSLTFDGDTDDWFVVSWTDGQDAESYLMKATNFKNESGTQKATFQYRKDGAWSDVKTDAEATDTISIGNVELTVGTLDKDAKTAVVSYSGSQMSFNTLFSKEGAKLYLPWANATAINITNITQYDDAAAACTASAVTTTGSQLGYNQSIAFNKTGDTTTASGTGYCASYPATYSLILSEEDKNENIGAGKNVTFTLGDTTNNEVSVTNVAPSTGGTSTEIQDTDMYRNFVYSELATEIMWDKSADQYKATVTYHGDEVTADIYVTSSDATVTSGGASALGNVLVKDSEVSTTDAMNLVIVGGSCINSAAATVLGGKYCGEMFTSMTGIGPGEFLIKGYEDSAINGKYALIVAGYEAADTANAATYLTKKTVDTSMAYKGTSETMAEVMVA